MMVEEKASGVLRPDAAAPEAIREPWRTHRRRGLCGRSVPLPDKVSLYAHNERHGVAIARERRLTRRRYYASLAALRIALDKPEWQDEHMIRRRAYAHRASSL